MTDIETYNRLWGKPQPPEPPLWLLWAALIAIAVGSLFFAMRAHAQDYTDEQIVNAIYHAEGGAKATFAYGIRSVPYRDIKEARRICFNTVRNNRKRFAKQGKYTDYIEFLGSRYCPVSAHPLNRNWVKNMRYFLARSK